MLQASGKATASAAVAAAALILVESHSSPRYSTGAAANRSTTFNADQLRT